MNYTKRQANSLNNVETLALPVDRTRIPYSRVELFSEARRPPL